MKRSTTLLSRLGILLGALASGCGEQPAPPPAPVPERVEAPPPSPTPEPGLECSCEKPKQPTPADAERHRRTAWLAAADRGTEGLADLRVTDQEGRGFKLSELRGRPFALTFLYTRCTNPNRCPVVATEIGRLQTLLEAEGLDSRVRVAIMTYDAEHDTPEKLKQYGLDHGIRFTPSVMMLRPDKQEKDHFFEKLRVTVNYDGAEVNIHGLQLFLFDDRARFVRRYQSVIWDRAEVLADLKRLAQEVP